MCGLSPEEFWRDSQREGAWQGQAIAYFWRMEQEEKRQALESRSRSRSRELLSKGELQQGELVEKTPDVSHAPHGNGKPQRK